MKDQLLDNSSTDGQTEIIESKNLLPIIFCLLFFPYLVELMVFASPGTNIFDTREYVKLVINIGYPVGALLYAFSGRKKQVIAFGFVLLVLACAALLLSYMGTMNFPGSSPAWVLSLGVGLTFYPLLSVFLQNSIAHGQKQKTTILLFALQGLVYIPVEFYHGYFIHPEVTGLLPILVSALFMLICMILVLRRSFTVDITEDLQQLPANFISKLTGWIVLILLVFISSQVITLKVPPGKSELDFGLHAPYVYISSTLLCILIVLIGFFAGMKFSVFNLAKIGAYTFIPCTLAKIFVLPTSEQIQYPLYFILGLHCVILISMLFFSFAFSVFLMRSSSSKNYVVLLAAMSLPWVLDHIIFISIHPWKIYDFLLGTPFYFLVGLSILSVVFLLLSLSQQTKTTITHGPDRQ